MTDIEIEELWKSVPSLWNPERPDKPKVIVTPYDIHTDTLKKNVRYWMLPGTSDQNPPEILPFIKDVVRLLPDGTRNCAMEIGLGAGGTHILLSVLFKHVITVERDRDRVCQVGMGLGANSTLITAHSMSTGARAVVEKELNGKQLDLLFIDGQHSFVTAQADHVNFEPFVRKGGIVTFHDSLNPNTEVVNYLATLPQKLVRYEFPIAKHPGAMQGIAYYIKE